jgi:hypothetical protein
MVRASVARISSKYPYVPKTQRRRRDPHDPFCLCTRVKATVGATASTHGLRGQTFSISPLSHPSSRPSVSGPRRERDDDSFRPHDTIPPDPTYRQIKRARRAAGFLPPSLTRKTYHGSKTKRTTLLPVEQLPSTTVPPPPLLLLLLLLCRLMLAPPKAMPPGNN